MSNTPIASPRPITGRAVLIAFILFFGVVFSVNGTMIWLSQTSWTGLVEEGAFEKGLGYNRVLEDAKAQELAGWASAVQFQPDAPGSLSGVLDLSLSLKGVPLEGASVTASLRRLTTDRYDHVLSFASAQTHAGHYQVPVTLPGAGKWEVRLSVTAEGSTFTDRVSFAVTP